MNNIRILKNELKIKENVYTIQLIQGKNKSKILVNEEVVWEDFIKNYRESISQEKEFTERSLYCLEQLSSHENIIEFMYFLGQDKSVLDAFIGLGNYLTFKETSECDLNEGLYM